MNWSTITEFLLVFSYTCFVVSTAGFLIKINKKINDVIMRLDDVLRRLDEGQK